MAKLGKSGTNLVEHHFLFTSVHPAKVEGCDCGGIKLEVTISQPFYTFELSFEKSLVDKSFNSILQGAGSEPGYRPEGSPGGVLLPRGPDRGTRGNDSRTHRLRGRVLHQSDVISGTNRTF